MSYNVLMDHDLFLFSPPSFVETVNSTTIKLSWGDLEYSELFNDLVGTPNATGYIIYHNVTSEGQLNEGGHTHVFQGLTPFTFYGFSVSAYLHIVLAESTFCAKSSDSVVARTEEDCKISHSEFVS